MPRLTDTQYLQQRKKLRANWFDQGANAFARLESPGQLALHDYFAPTEEFNEHEALQHRAEVTKSWPSLPQKAGRAYQSALPYLDRPAPEPPALNRAQRRHIPKGSRRVVVRAVRRPKVDTHKLSRALIAMMEARLKERDKEDHTAS